MINKVFLVEERGRVREGGERERENKKDTFE
jgi:hypothetical protein